jgi:hypothetical protein
MPDGIGDHSPALALKFVADVLYAVLDPRIRYA